MNLVISGRDRAGPCAKLQSLVSTRRHNRAECESRQDSVDCVAASFFWNLTAPFQLAVPPVGAIPPGTHHGKSVGKIPLCPHNFLSHGIKSLGGEDLHA